LETIIHEHTLQALLTWLAGLSLATFLLSLLLIPFIVRKLPPDCFILLCATNRDKLRHTAGSVILLILRSIIGVFLLIAGFAMLFFPGQGILTMLLGILLLSFPGKQRLISYLIRFPGIRQGLEWLRVKSGKQPFIWPEK
jgi:hypothetical protein